MGETPMLRKMKFVRWIIIVGYLFLAALPLVWMGLTSVKRYDDTISRNPRLVPVPPSATPKDDSPLFPATTDGYAKLAEPTRSTGHSFYHYLANSVIIGVC